MRNVTVVTGAAGGIGAAVSERLAQEGHLIGVAFRESGESAQAVLERVRQAGSDGFAVRADITSEGDVERLFDTVARELGPVTGLVNNAGITGTLGPFESTSIETFRDVLDTNVLGTLLCCRKAARVMSVTGGGSIVNVSSAAATLGSAGEYVHYAASKAAVDALTIGLSKELATNGIRVNSVQPGTVTTGIHAAMGDPDRPQRTASRVPMKRPGRPGEIAEAIAWLLSDKASFTTGAVLRVSGGI
ncbi:SDR family oxidoreductase [Streptomyces sp. NRRL S-15]|uniref:SDR family oxidoreductase n=1 Tax=Streptomyces sp. NRRL S-15 TaxID=1463886 RepID=UPI0004CC4F49|nr:SDR family oxidoreductase [Streptomyces sp. NRRL S-15]